jgi:hypothetical protein
MRSSHNLGRVETTFDDDSVVPNGGLQAPAALAQELGIAELVDKRVKLRADQAGRANCGVKAMTVVGAMLTGGDSIDDCAVLRAGAAPKVFTDTRAPSTLGTWLRGFNWAAVRMFDAVARVVLARAWAAGLGPDRNADLATTATCSCANAWPPTSPPRSAGPQRANSVHLAQTSSGTPPMRRETQSRGSDMILRLAVRHAHRRRLGGCWRVVRPPGPRRGESLDRQPVRRAGR